MNERARCKIETLVGTNESSWTALASLMQWISKDRGPPMLLMSISHPQSWSHNAHSFPPLGTESLEKCSLLGWRSLRSPPSDTAVHDGARECSLVEHLPSPHLRSTTRRMLSTTTRRTRPCHSLSQRSAFPVLSALRRSLTSPMTRLHWLRALQKVLTKVSSASTVFFPCFHFQGFCLCHLVRLWTVL
jgi:hypothetical protein